jgi:hypothetical protein
MQRGALGLTIGYTEVAEHIRYFQSRVGHRSEGRKSRKGRRSWTGFTQFRQQHRNLPAKPGQRRLGDMPDPAMIDCRVAVNQNIAEPDDLAAVRYALYKIRSDF